MKVKNSSLKSTKSQASLLPDTNIGVKKYSIIDDSNSLASIILQSNSKD